MASTPLRERRLDSGLTQAELAARAGVSRQLVAAVEAGRHAPAVDAALGLARALGTSVEQLFGEPRWSSSPVAALGGVPARDVPLRLGRVGEQLIAVELADHGVAGAGWATSDAVFSGGRLRSFGGAVAAGVVIAGCDPALGIVERMLEGLGQRSLLAVSAPTDTALRALAAGRVHAAVVHGRVNQLPVPPVPVAAWHVARWQVGVAVAPAAHAYSLEDALRAELPFVSREPAAASQQAFERARTAAGIGALPGARVAAGHLDAARLAALLNGAGITTESAAHAFGLRFLALEEHTVELWVAERWLDHAGVEAVLELFASSAFAQRVAPFGGYDLSGCGQRIELSATGGSR